MVDPRHQFSNAAKYAHTSDSALDQLMRKTSATDSLERAMAEESAISAMWKTTAASAAISAAQEGDAWRRLSEKAAYSIAPSEAFTRAIAESDVVRSFRQIASASAALGRALEESTLMRSFRENALATTAFMRAFEKDNVFEKLRATAEIADAAIRSFATSDAMKSIRTAEFGVRSFAASEVAQWHCGPRDGNEAPASLSTSQSAADETQNESDHGAAEGRLIVQSISQSFLSLLRKSPEAIHSMSPAHLEDLVHERFEAFGFDVERVGKTNTPDGGIDLIAFPKVRTPLPYFVAVQVKHKQNGQGSIGAPLVRDFAGAMLTVDCGAGMLVTNASFTDDAKWVADQRHGRLQLRDFEDLKKWIRGDFGREILWKALPERIQVRPGLFVRVPTRL